MLADYVRYWLTAPSVAHESPDWWTPTDPRLSQIWVPHTVPATATFDPLLKGLLVSLKGAEAPGYTRRIEQVRQIVSAAQCTKDDIVLECFCGPGSITIPLALQCKRVIGVEGDSAVAEALRVGLRRESIDNVDIISGDIRDTRVVRRVLALGRDVVSKQVHTPAYMVIPEVFAACAGMVCKSMIAVLPLSLIRTEWAAVDYPHIAAAERWFRREVELGTLDVVGVWPIEKPGGGASSGIFKLVWHRSEEVGNHA